MKKTLIALSLFAASSPAAFATEYNASIAELKKIISSDVVKSSVGLGSALVSTEKKFNNGYYYVLRFNSRISGNSCIIARPTYMNGLVSMIKVTECD